MVVATGHAIERTVLAEDYAACRVAAIEFTGEVVERFLGPFCSLWACLEYHAATGCRAVRTAYVQAPPKSRAENVSRLVHNDTFWLTPIATPCEAIQGGF